METSIESLEGKLDPPLSSVAPESTTVKKPVSADAAKARRKFPWSRKEASSLSLPVSLDSSNIAFYRCRRSPSSPPTLKSRTNRKWAANWTGFLRWRFPSLWLVLRPEVTPWTGSQRLHSPYQRASWAEVANGWRTCSHQTSLEQLQQPAQMRHQGKYRIADSQLIHRKIGFLRRQVVWAKGHHMYIPNFAINVWKTLCTPYFYLGSFTYINCIFELSFTEVPEHVPFFLRKS